MKSHPAQKSKRHFSKTQPTGQEEPEVKKVLSLLVPLPVNLEGSETECLAPNGEHVGRHLFVRRLGPHRHLPFTRVVTKVVGSFRAGLSSLNLPEGSWDHATLMKRPLTQTGNKLQTRRRGTRSGPVAKCHAGSESHFPALLGGPASLPLTTVLPA